MAASDAKPIPRKNQAYRLTFAIFDADGDLVTGAAGLDSEVSKDGGTFADCSNEATEIATSSGVYYLDLTASEMNADTVAVITKTSTTGAKTTLTVITPEEAGDIKVDVERLNGSAVQSDSGYIRVSEGTGTGQLDLTSGRPGIDWSKITQQGATVTLSNTSINTVSETVRANTLYRGSVAGTPTATSVELLGGGFPADAFVGHVLVLPDSSTAGRITAFDEATGVATIDPPLLVTPAALEEAYIVPTGCVSPETIASAAWANATRTLTSGANISLDKGTGLTGLNDPTAASVASAVRTELATELARVDVATSTRAASSSITSLDTKIGTPAGASVSADVAAVKSDTATLTGRITSSLFAGITSLAQWIGLLAGKQVGNSTARNELRATGAGSGTFDETADSLEAQRDNAPLASDIAAVKAKTDLLPSASAGASGGVAIVGSAMTLAADAVNASSVSASAATEIGAAVTVTFPTIDGLTFASWGEVLLAFVAGRADVADNVVTYRKQDGTTAKVRITFGATPGERTDTEIDPS